MSILRHAAMFILISWSRVFFCVAREGTSATQKARLRMPMSMLRIRVFRLEEGIRGCCRPLDSRDWRIVLVPVVGRPMLSRTVFRAAMVMPLAAAPFPLGAMVTAKLNIQEDVIALFGTLKYTRMNKIKSWRRRPWRGDAKVFEGSSYRSRMEACGSQMIPNRPQCFCGHPCAEKSVIEGQKGMWSSVWAQEPIVKVVWCSRAMNQSEACNRSTVDLPQQPRQRQSTHNLEILIVVMD